MKYLMTPKEFSFHYVSAHELDVASGIATLHIDFLQGEAVHIYLEPCPKDLIEIAETPVLTPFPGAEKEDGLEVDLGYSKLHIGFDLNFKLIREGASFAVRHEKDGEDYHLRFPLSEATRIYGLGDKLAPLNRRGYRYRNWNTDESKVQHEWSHSLYKSLNYLLLNEEGIFLPLSPIPSTSAKPSSMNSKSSRRRATSTFIFFVAKPQKKSLLPIRAFLATLISSGLRCWAITSPAGAMAKNPR